jgi:hypothetical protein
VHAGCVTTVPCLPQTSDSLHSERTRQCISSASFKSGISAYTITRGCSDQTRSMDLKGQLLLLELRVLCRMGLKRKLACSWNLARPMTESLNWAMPDEVSQVLEETLVSYRTKQHVLQAFQIPMLVRPSPYRRGTWASRRAPWT